MTDLIDPPSPAPPQRSARGRLRPEQESPTTPRRRRLAILAAALVLVLAVAFRFLSRSELWLDEALSVNISRLARRDIPDALRRDGSPPLYYLLLHYWMRIFGEGNVAVRALSGAFSVLTIPVMWLIGLRLGGRRLAWTMTYIIATIPYAIRYATETRMYSLLMLLTAVGFLALHESLHRPRPLAFGTVAVVSGSLALTHYWSFYLLAAVAACLAVRAWRLRATGLRRHVSPIAAMAAGGLLFVPWIPSFVFQLRHTGTPWAVPANFNAIFNTIGDFTGGDNAPGRALLLVALALAGLGLFGRPLDRRRIELDLQTNPHARGPAAVTMLTLAIGLAIGLVFGGAFAPRYAAVVLVPFVVLVSLGTITIADARIRRSIVAVFSVLGLISGLGAVLDRRTEAPLIAAAINERARPGDIVVYCPDQLGPAVSRLITVPVQQVTFPADTPPQFVDWVDYQQRQKASDPTKFTEMIDARAGAGHDVWVVWNHGYRTYSNYCEIIDRDMGDLRPKVELVVRRRLTGYGEPSWLFRYPGSCRRPLERREFPPDCPGAQIRPPQ